MTLFNSNTNMKKLLLSLAAILMASAAFTLSAQEVEAETKAAAEELSDTAAAAAAELCVSTRPSYSESRFPNILLMSGRSVFAAPSAAPARSGRT